MARRLDLTQTRLGFFERLVGALSLVFDPGQLLAQIAILVGSLRRFVLPLLSALSDFGQWAHHARARQDTPPQVTDDPLGR